MGDDDEVTIWLDTVRQDQKRTKDNRIASKDELEEALAFACATARRQQFVIGTRDYPTKYDKAHAHIDWLLDMLVGR